MAVEHSTIAVLPGGQLRAMFFSPNARVARFALTGGLAGFAQLTLLTLFKDQEWHAIGANALAFLLAAQINFVLSNLFTWPDRRVGQTLGRRWLIFHGSIAGMALVNMAVFAITRTVAPDLAASAAGIGVAASGNFFIGDHLVFRPRTGSAANREQVGEEPAQSCPEPGTLTEPSAKSCLSLDQGSDRS